MKSFLVLFLLLMSTSSFAIRHVGSGGGEAELKVWQFAQFLPYWAQGCNTNPDLCWNGGELSSNFETAVRGLKIEFVNQSENKQMCGVGQVTLTHEELYWDEDRNSATPEIGKSDSELATILLKSVLACQGSSQAEIANLNISILPHGALLNQLGIIVLTGDTTDLIFLQGSTRNLHAELAEKMQCNQYAVTSFDANGFLVQCKTKQESYLVIPQMQNGELILNVRYNSEVDF